MLAASPLEHTLFDYENDPSVSISETLARRRSTPKMMGVKIGAALKPKSVPAWFDEKDKQGMDAVRAVLAALGISQYWPRVEVCMCTMDCVKIDVEA